jgi:hypothetical protein
LGDLSPSCKGLHLFCVNCDPIRRGRLAAGSFLIGCWLLNEHLLVARVCVRVCSAVLLVPAGCLVWSILQTPDVFGQYSIRFTLAQTETLTQSVSARSGSGYGIESNDRDTRAVRTGRGDGRPARGEGKPSLKRNGNHERRSVRLRDCGGATGGVSRILTVPCGVSCNL